MTTFSDLGAPFPLFEAEVSDAADFSPGARCSVCGQVREVGFLLGIGCALMMECRACATVNGLDASDGDAVRCRHCTELIPFPEVADPIVSCYSCLRAGRAAITKDTELGMISWEQAFEGVTHGVPGLSRSEFDLVPRGDGWVGARLPEAAMFELLRTPAYSTIQGDCWLFCCQGPMIYLGEWAQRRFVDESPDGDGRAYFESIVDDAPPGLWEGALHDVTGIYVFRCAACSRVRGHWDVA